MNCIQAMQKLVQGFLDGNNKVSSKTKVLALSAPWFAVAFLLAFPDPEYRVNLSFDLCVLCPSLPTAPFDRPPFIEFLAFPCSLGLPPAPVAPRFLSLCAFLLF